MGFEGQPRNTTKYIGYTEMLFIFILLRQDDFSRIDAFPYRFMLHYDQHKPHIIIIIAYFHFVKI